MDNKNLKLSLIIPCYNESDNIKLLIDRISKIEYFIDEIILVNNGSTDTTGIIAEKLIYGKSNYKLINIEINVGYGDGIMSGVREASGDIIAWTHADLQTDPQDVIDAFNAYVNYPDFKSSIIKGKRIKRNFFDFFFTYCMSLLSSFLLKVKVSDVNAQPKMFHRNFLNRLKNYPKDFSLDLYLLYIAKINHYKVYEHPVYFKKRMLGMSKGGGTILGKIYLIKNTINYILNLKSKMKK